MLNDVKVMITKHLKICVGLYGGRYIAGQIRCPSKPISPYNTQGDVSTSLVKNSSMTYPSDLKFGRRA